MRKERAFVVIEVLSLLAYIWYVYDTSVGFPTAVEINYSLSNSCYRLAFWFGRKGMRAERRYHDIIDRERTV